MIELKNIYVRKECGKIYFCATTKINEQKQQLWFSTQERFEKYIALSNGDAFILFIFMYAVFENLEFKSKVPISKRLKFGLLEGLLPAFQEMGFKTNLEQFTFEQEDEMMYLEANAVGTAMSFGVDSFFTFLQGGKSIQKLNCLTLFNAGAFGQYGSLEATRLFENMKTKVDDFAVENKFEFVWVDTNLNDVFRMPFVQTHTFRNFACVLVLQKFFKTYYYASGININAFKLNKLDPAYYDLLNSKVIKTNSLEFHISGLTENRMDKTKMISQSDITFDKLNVCLITPDNRNLKTTNKLQNCSKCFKCIRTMVSLDVIGKLKQYYKVFDLSIYRKNKNKYLAELMYKKYRANDVLAKEIFNEAKSQNYCIPFVVYFLVILRAFQPIIRKLKNV